MPVITDPNEPYFKDGAWGWDGSVWRRLTLLWGYSDRWVATDTGTAVGAGDAVATIAPVPPGYVYVLQGACAWHTAAAANRLQIAPTDGALSVYQLDVAAATPGVAYPIQGAFALKEGDTVTAIAAAPGAGRLVVLRVWGYKMLIAA